MVSRPITKTRILVPVNMWCPKYVHLEVSSLCSKSFSNYSTGWSNVKGVPFMLNNLYGNIINGRVDWTKKILRIWACTLWAHAYKKTNGVMCPLTDVMFLYLFSTIKSLSPKIRFWNINFHTTALYLLALWIALLTKKIKFFHFFLNSITHFFRSRTMRMFRIKSNYLISSVCAISGDLSASYD